jgi:hypothetical protein
LTTEAHFECVVCGREAGTIELRGDELRRESFTGVLTQRASPEAREQLGDPAALYALDPELVPFYCPPCGASYCSDHWERRDVFDDDAPDWHDSIRGRCPRGHERMLED